MAGYGAELAPLSGSAHFNVSSKLFVTADIVEDIRRFPIKAPNRSLDAIFDLIYYEISPRICQESDRN